VRQLIAMGRSANVAQRAKEREWEAEHEGEFLDPAWFSQVVVPALAGVTLPTISKATGLSTTAASKIRAGQRIPHRRHWAKLTTLVGID